MKLQQVSQSCPISVIAGADDRFAIGLAVTLFSALANLDPGSAIDFYIIDGGISDRNKQKLQQVLTRDSVSVRLRWLQPNLEALQTLQISDRWGLAAFFRLLAPELLPPELDRVIYLDSDLVIEGNLQELWEKELGNSPALAVQDYWIPYVSMPCALPETYQQLRLAADAAFFNSGMIVLNLKQWREHNLAQKALDYADRFHAFDQEAINAAMAGEWKRLDWSWNVQVCGVVRPAMKLPDQPERMVQKAAIIHFNSPDKPWQPLYKLHGGERFACYLKQSNWFNRLEYLKWFVSARLPQKILFPLASLKRHIQKEWFHSYSNPLLTIET
jgi:lipopolysaccharide biosynthesis glycosyltransferase